jgi:DNA repair photolyase
MSYYQSPRWSNEILDCAMPMTFDTYSNCAFSCSYCFSQFQRGIGQSSENYNNKGNVKFVNIDKVKRMFTEPDKSQFGWYIKNRYTMQWGGLSDCFDGFEKKFGKTLELLHFFKEIKYPISFSTKSTWFLKDKRYLDVLKDTGDFWHFKISIITLDEQKARAIERGVRPPLERIENFSILKDLGIKSTLRLRPFIIGVSDPSYIELIERSIKNGIYSISTEFFCLEARSKEVAKKNYSYISDQCGFDIVDFYIKHSEGQSGYLRLNYEIKKPYMREIVRLCKENNLILGVSDSSCKLLGNTGGCCGIPLEKDNKKFKPFKGQLTQMIQDSIQDGTNELSFSKLDKDIDMLDKINFKNAEGYNTNTLKKRNILSNYTLKDIIRKDWNTPTSRKSPYFYTDKNLKPIRIDENDNTVYKIIGDTYNTIK